VWLVCRKITGLWLRIKNEAENQEILEERGGGLEGDRHLKGNEMRRKEYSKTHDVTLSSS